MTQGKLKTFRVNSMRDLFELPAKPSSERIADGAFILRRFALARVDELLLQIESITAVAR